MNRNIQTTVAKNYVNLVLLFVLMFFSLITEKIQYVERQQKKKLLKIISNKKKP